MIVRTGHGGRFGPAFGGAQNGELRFGHRRAVRPHPDEVIVALGRLDVNQRSTRHTSRARHRDAYGIVRVGSRRIHHGWQCLHGARQFRVVLRCLFPYLPRIGSQIHFVVAVVEHARLFGIEVADGVGFFVFKK